MDLSILRKIGLTEGEIKVYKALLSTGQSSTGEIMKKSGISSSKVYLILDKLVYKGLVSFILQDNVKHFQITNPKTILEYVDKKKEELDLTRNELKKLIPKIETNFKYEEETAQIYKGVKGVAVAYNQILDELEKGDEYCFFAISPEESQEEKTIEFFTKFHLRRVEKGIHARAIADSYIEKLYKKKHVLGKLYSLKHYPLTLPVGVVITKNRVLYIAFSPEPIAHEIVSKQIAKRYQDFFDKIWKIAKK